jgi:hypothetical protein
MIGRRFFRCRTGDRHAWHRLRADMPFNDRWIGLKLLPHASTSTSAITVRQAML